METNLMNIPNHVNVIFSLLKIKMTLEYFLRCYNHL